MKGHLFPLNMAIQQELNFANQAYVIYKISEI